MKSYLTDKFLEFYQHLPNHVKRGAGRSYKIWRKNPNHPGLQFRKVGKKHEVYSVRVGIGWRALGVKDKNAIIWFWIGSHAEYDQLLKQS